MGVAYVRQTPATIGGVNGTIRRLDASTVGRSPLARRPVVLPDSLPQHDFPTSMFSLKHCLRALTVLAFALLFYGCSDEASPTGPGGDGDADAPPTQFDSKAAPGDSAHAFLDDGQFSVLHIEIDYMEGYEPTEPALDSLKTALNTHLSKRSIRIGTPSRVPAAGQDAYSADQVRDLEEQYRDQYTRAQSDTIRAYFLVVDGKYTDENVLGIAYYNTSMAFFGQTLEEITGGLTQPSRENVEATVFRHEFGHNLGLVNNGTPMQQAHQDDGNGHHCTNEECVMYYAIETTDYFANLFDGTIPDFEELCTEDMSAQRGG